MKLDKWTRISLGLFEPEDFEGVEHPKLVIFCIIIIPLIIMGILVFCGGK